MIDYKYIHRAKCLCGFIWTTPSRLEGDMDSTSVVCKCGNLQFINGDLIGTSLEFTEEEFNNAVANDIGENISNLNIIQVNGSS